MTHDEQHKPDPHDYPAQPRQSTASIQLLPACHSDRRPLVVDLDPMRGTPSPVRPRCNRIAFYPFSARPSRAQFYSQVYLSKILSSPLGWSMQNVSAAWQRAADLSRLNLDDPAASPLPTQSLLVRVADIPGKSVGVRCCSAPAIARSAPWLRRAC
jgi:hypothetical protein